MKLENSQRGTLFEKLGRAGIDLHRLRDHYPEEMHSFQIEVGAWTSAAKLTEEEGLRLVSLWVAETEGNKSTLFAYAVFARPCYGRILFRAALESAVLPSISRYFIYASRMERTINDMFGIKIEKTEDSRRWIKHEHWPDGRHPLRSSFARDAAFLPDNTGEYKFIEAEGEGICEIPVGPVHAGIIEPGHFHFLAAGEEILNLEERLGYAHKGIEKRIEGMNAFDAVKIAGRVSGDTTVGHAWAFSTACENSSRLDVPERAVTLRGILCERERIANHIGDIGAVCNDAAFSFIHSQMQRLREDMAEIHKTIFGHRLLMDLIVPGGVAFDIHPEAMEQLSANTRQVVKEVRELREIYVNNASIQERVTGSGVIETEIAKSAGLLGFAGRASGILCDTRINHPYPPYNRLNIRGVCKRHGDVASRIKVRFDEICESAEIICELLEQIPEGAVSAGWTAPPEACSGFSAVEGWRGEIAYWISFNKNGVITRCMIKDPSVVNWLGLELAVRGLPVPEFPLNNKSFNCSYSGNDL